MGFLIAPLNENGCDVLLHVCFRMKDFLEHVAPKILSLGATVPEYITPHCYVKKTACFKCSVIKSITL